MQRSRRHSRAHPPPRGRSRHRDSTRMPPWHANDDGATARRQAGPRATTKPPRWSRQPDRRARRNRRPASPPRASQRAPHSAPSSASRTPWSASSLVSQDVHESAVVVARRWCVSNTSLLAQRGLALPPIYLADTSCYWLIEQRNVGGSQHSCPRGGLQRFARPFRRGEDKAPSVTTDGTKRDAVRRESW